MAGYTKRLVVDGSGTDVSGTDAAEPLLYVLRNGVGARGPKYGCGVSQCGACTVLVDDQIVRSCVRPVQSVRDGAEIRTLDALGTDEEPHPIQREMMARDAGQCAYCVNGIVMGSLGWLEARAAAGDRSIPTAQEIQQFLSGHLDGYTLNYLCRCGAHPRYVEAIQAAAAEVIG